MIKRYVTRNRSYKVITCFLTILLLFGLVMPIHNIVMATETDTVEGAIEDPLLTDAEGGTGTTDLGDGANEEEQGDTTSGLTEQTSIEDTNADSVVFPMVTKMPGPENYKVTGNSLEEDLKESPASDETEIEVSEERGTENALALMNDAPLAVTPEDPNYIVVEKNFIGISADQIPASFQITVSPSTGDAYTLNKGKTDSKETDTDGKITWRWKITGVGAGTYAVSEANETVQNYNVTKSGEGTVQVIAADFAVDVPYHETKCSQKNWPVKIDGDDNFLFAATLTDQSIVVISKTSLSASQRATVSSKVLTINGPWKEPVYFYSVDQQDKNGFEVPGGAVIKYDSQKGEIYFDRTSYWQHVAILKYSISEANNPEIALTNSYERAVTDVTVTKTVAGSIGDYEQNFDFTVTVKTGDTDETFKLGETKYTGSASFTLKHKESITLKDVPIGATVAVSETDYSMSRYSTSYMIDVGSQSTGNTAIIQNVEENGHSVVFTNNKDVIPDTGVLLDSLPYILILGVVVASAAIMIVRKRRINTED